MVKLPEKYMLSYEIISRINEVCIKNNEKEKRRKYLGMSQIGFPCERKLWLDYKQAEQSKIDGKQARIFEMGHIIEERIVSYLKAAGFQLDDQQLEFSDFDDRFKGHCDGILYITKNPHILEIKSINDTGFKALQQFGMKKTRESYIAQVQVYMGYANLKRAIFIVENKNNQDLYSERVYFDKDEFERLKEKALRILNAENPFDKPENNKDCFFCPYQEKTCKEADVNCDSCVYFLSKEKMSEILGVEISENYCFYGLKLKCADFKICENYLKKQ